MKRLLVNAAVVAILITISLTTTNLVAQMGLRENEYFSPPKFAKQGPTIGELAPELELTDLEGNSVSLESYRGQVIVLVKGGFT